jgi:hypothetical protein
VDPHYLGIALWRGRGWVNVKLTEPTAESEMLFAREFLIAKKNHLMTEQCITDRPESCVVQFRQVDSMDFGTYVGCYALYFAFANRHFPLPASHGVSRKPPLDGSFDHSPSAPVFGIESPAPSTTTLIL